MATSKNQVASEATECRCSSAVSTRTPSLKPNSRPSPLTRLVQHLRTTIQNPKTKTKPLNPQPTITNEKRTVATATAAATIVMIEHHRGPSILISNKSNISGNKERRSVSFSIPPSPPRPAAPLSTPRLFGFRAERVSDERVSKCWKREWAEERRMWGRRRFQVMG